MTNILITKSRTAGNQTIRADSGNPVGSGTWVNVSTRGIDLSIEIAREKEAEYAAIADELEQVRAQGVDW